MSLWLFFFNVKIITHNSQCRSNEIHLIMIVSLKPSSSHGLKLASDLISIKPSPDDKILDWS